MKLDLRPKGKKLGDSPEPCGKKSKSGSRASPKKSTCRTSSGSRKDASGENDRYRASRSVVEVRKALRPFFRPLKNLSHNEVSEALAILARVYDDYPSISSKSRTELLLALDDSSDELASILLLGIYSVATRCHTVALAAAPNAPDGKKRFWLWHKLSCWWVEIFEVALTRHGKLWSAEMMIRRNLGY